jgi:hypothetical protein
MKIADSIEAALKSETLEVQAKNVASMIEEGVRKALGELPASYKVQAEVNDGFMSYYQDFVSFCRKGSFSIN